jgi:hypothetical protein
MMCSEEEQEDVINAKNKIFVEEKVFLMFELLFHTAQQALPKMLER